MPLMRNRTPLLVVIAAAFLMVSVETGSAGAQWIRYPDPATPRTSDGKPNLTAPAKLPEFRGQTFESSIWNG
jgi:hypothetical protein